ncbi:MAG TPA: hypothetical protein ENK18_23470, partial [Deltaproteobacteria bacterium]|nr:hypothetical protein [Deltaproteobacteria bacterium]
MRWSLPFLIACTSHGSVDFPAQLAPLEDNRAPLPVGSGPYPESLSIVSGGDTELWWAHAQGFVHAPLEEVWVHAQEDAVCVDRREVEAWTTSEGTVPGFDASYTIHNTVRDIITVQYDTTWVHEIQDRDEADIPVRIVAQWDKTAGTPFIDLLAGSVVLEAVEPDVTKIGLIEHLDASLRDDATI